MTYSIGRILQIISLSCLVAVIVCHPSVSAADAATRIVGGSEITITKAPYLVNLRTNAGHFFCGGTLISPRHVLTAAHCFDTRNYKDAFVIGGASTLLDEGVQRDIAAMVKHPEYKIKDFHTDMAILTLVGEMSGANIEPATLCQQAVQEGFLLEIYGWGTTYDAKNAPPSVELRTIRVPVRSPEICEAEYGRFVEKNMFCASGLEAKGTCIGDSGGPAMFGGEVCGVAAFMNKCGEVGHTAAFTDVNAVLPFIKKVTGI